MELIIAARPPARQPKPASGETDGRSEARGEDHGQARMAEKRRRQCEGERRRKAPLALAARYFRRAILG